jgi:hypothetical protein
MVQRRQRERSLFEVLLPDGHKLWPDWLRKIDTLLEDDAVIEGMREPKRATLAAPLTRMKLRRDVVLILDPPKRARMAVLAVPHGSGL